MWWLYDDGGLTVLIPYLLQSHELWRECKLRIMALGNLGMAEQNKLAAHMRKPRIKAAIGAPGAAYQNGAVQCRVTIAVGEQCGGDVPGAVQYNVLAQHTIDDSGAQQELIHADRSADAAAAVTSLATLDTSV